MADDGCVTDRTSGERHVFTYGATMDLMIIHELLVDCIEASTILDVDPANPQGIEPPRDALRLTEAAVSR